MILTESWSKWEPIPNLAPKYVFHELIDEYENFKIILNNATNPKEQVILDCRQSSVHFQRKTPMALRTKTLEQLKKEHGDTFVNEWTFFKVNNNFERQRLINEADGWYDFNNIQHIVLLTTHDCMELLLFNDPVITTLTTDKQQ